MRRQIRWRPITVSRKSETPAFNPKCVFLSSPLRGLPRRELTYPSPFQEDILVVGRICPESDTTKLTPLTTWFESSRILGNGQRVLLAFNDDMKVRGAPVGSGGVGFFPGCLVGLKGRNGSGTKFVVSEVLMVCLPSSSFSVLMRRLLILRTMCRCRLSTRRTLVLRNCSNRNMESNRNNWEETPSPSSSLLVRTRLRKTSNTLLSKPSSTEHKRRIRISSF